MVKRPERQADTLTLTGWRDPETSFPWCSIRWHQWSGSRNRSVLW